ncbi:MAG: adenylyltransferase/cytidyltransferase family protein [Candidatus Micrarchaeota archaeon]
MRKKITVLTGGVFDIIHPGHVFLLEKCRKLGGRLVVVVASDETARRAKRRAPLHAARDRARIVAALKPVDVAMVGDARDPFKVVKRVKPDIIAYGYDQKISEKMRARLSAEGMKTRIVKIKDKLNEHIFKTSKIIRRAAQRHNAGKSR